VSRPDTGGACTLNFEERGSGRPLVILHGLLGSLANWRGVARALAVRFRVVSLDARNHGRSPHTAVHGYPAMAADTAATIESLGLGPSTVIGHSMGGKTAMTLALMRPDLVERLVVLDIAPRAYLEAEGTADVVRALAEIDLSDVSGRGDVEARLATAVPDAGMRAFLMMNLRRQGEEGFSWRCNLETLVRCGREIAMEVESEEAYRGPALFVRGGWSRYVTGSDDARIRTLFPAADILTLPEAGHWLHVEAPEALVDCVARFAAAD
jgi:pimeloyl-ACP methyl ester carboxylesterase